MLLSNLNLLATTPDGVARLRELILTLAVQGKLVPQDASDEPVSELLKKIRAEKDRLIAEGKIKRDKPLDVIAEDEKPFELPQGWEWVRNETLLTLRKGKNPKTLSDQPIGKPYLDIEALDRHQVRRYSNEAQVVLCTANDILVVCDGSRSGLVLQGKEGIVGSTLAVIETPQFIQAYVKLIFRAGFQRFNSGMKGAAIPHLDTKAVLSEVTGLPPLAEQSRIVTRVEELMRLCDALEVKDRLEATQHEQLVRTLLGTLTASTTPEELTDHWYRVATHFDLLLDRPSGLDALEQTILQLAVRGLLVPQHPQDEPASELLKKIRLEKDRLIAEGKIKRDKPLPPIAEDEKPFELPEGWEWVRLGDVANIASNLVQPALHRTAWQVAPDCIEKGTGRLLTKRTVAQSEVISANHLFKPGQILYSKIRPSLSKAVLVDFAGLCSADMYPIETSLDSQYLLMFILSQPFLDQVSIAENRVKMPKLNQEALVAFSVALPPLTEQSRIVERVASLRALCLELRQRLTTARTQQTLLAEVLVGEVA